MWGGGGGGGGGEGEGEGKGVRGGVEGSEGKSEVWEGGGKSREG